jgi:hypothetical protein
MGVSNLSDVFVFGSNELGIHGAGAAKHAKQFFGAVQGQGFGRQGDSFAIPTKASPSKTLPLDDIRVYVDEFLTYATEHFWESFNVTAIGCGLAGYSPEDIAPMFKQVPENVNLPQEFKNVLQTNRI